MADRKISDLTALTAPAAGDYLPIVDISEASAANKNKRITIEELLRGAPDGTAAAPSIGFESDPNTGIYRPGADQVAISTGGTARLFVDSSGNVGVGTTSPGSIFDVKPSASASTIRYEVGTLNSDSIRISAGGTVNTYLEYRGYLGHAWFVDATERARIDSSGRLLVGTSSARANFYNASTSPRFQVEGTNTDTSSIGLISSANGVFDGANLLFAKSRGTTIGSNTIVQNGDSLGFISFQGSDGTEFVDAANIGVYVDGTPGANDMPGRLVFSTTADGASSPTEAMRINNQREVLIGTNTRTANGGVLQVSNGITFPATQSACSDPNTLDDYEEGSCTITLFDSSGNSATMGAGNVFQYRKIGSFVLVSGTLVWSSTSALLADSRIRLTGLPFAGNGTYSMRWPGVVGSSSPGAFLITRSEFCFGLDFGNSFLWGTKTTGNNDDGSLTKADLGSSGTLYGVLIAYNT